MALDLPLIWGFILAVGVMMYVLLDGFDLGVGMLTFVARSDEERNMMTATIEPVWDGNETWLITRQFAPPHASSGTAPSSAVRPRRRFRKGSCWAV